MVKCLLLAFAVVATTACGGEESPGTAGPILGEVVRFEASDGVRLEGRSFGSGEVAVVLSHMGRGNDSQVDWYPLARELAAQGYRAITYNRRGVCREEADGCSGGVDELSESWKDVVGAYRYAKEAGADEVVLGGASVGAMSSLHAATRPGVDATAVVEVGGINHASGYSFEREDIAGIEGAMLFVSSEGDSYGGADAARQWHRWADGPKQLVILEGSDHGTDLLRPENELRGRLIGAIVDFLRREVPPS